MQMRILDHFPFRRWTRLFQAPLLLCLMMSGAMVVVPGLHASLHPGHSPDGCARFITRHGHTHAHDNAGRRHGIRQQDLRDSCVICDELALVKYAPPVSPSPQLVVFDGITTKADEPPTDPVRKTDRLIAWRERGPPVV